MSKSKKPRKQYIPTTIEQARDELFSHILRCGVLEAAEEHRKDWFDDTMDYLADRYEDLSDKELADLRTLGERYCQPVTVRAEQATSGETATAGVS
jgi:methylphosphotriester-DNA--protein-cysteine methyltransferase